MESKRWSTGYTLMTSKTKRWSKEEINRNNEIENKMIFEGFTPEDYGTGRRLIAHCETKEIADKIVKCVNTNEELVSTLKKVQGLLAIMPNLRMANTTGFDDCINISTVMQLNDHITNVLYLNELETAPVN